jgi:hypothetical protein
MFWISYLENAAATYAAVGLIVGIVATYQMRSMFVFGTKRLLRMAVFCALVGLFWWIFGPMLITFGRQTTVQDIQN